MTASPIPPPPSASAIRLRPGKQGQLTQCVSIQRTAFDLINKLADDFDNQDDPTARTKIATAIAQVGKLWESALERNRIIRNRPLPGSLRPELPTKRRKSRSAPASILEPGVEPSALPASPEPPENVSESVGKPVNQSV